MFSQFSCLVVLVACSSAFRVDSDFMTTADLERYFSVSTFEEVPEYEIVDPIAYSPGGRHRRDIEHEGATKEIKLQAFGEEFHMKLDKNTQLLAEGLEVDVHGEEGLVEKVPLKTKNCFYHGELLSHEGATVAVSTCDGVMGMIGTETHDVFIQPLTKDHKQKYQRRRRDVENPHVIYRRSTANPNEDDAFCALDPEYYQVSEHMGLRTSMASMAHMHQVQAALAPPPVEVIVDLDDEDTATMEAFYGDDDEITTDFPAVTEGNELDEEEDDEEDDDDDESNGAVTTESTTTEETTESIETVEDEDDDVTFTTESPEADETTESTETDEDEDEDDDKGRRGEGGGGGGGGGGHGRGGGKGRATDGDGSSSRKKRQTNVKYLEVRVLADLDMVNYHGADGVIPYTLTLMNIVAARYKDPSLAPTIIHIHIVKLGYLTTNTPSERTPNGGSASLYVNEDGPTTLTSWSNFQYETNPYSDIVASHWDNGILISRKNLAIEGRNSLLGIAWGNATCYGPRQANVNQDQGLSSGIVIAHEIGHTLGMNHDNDNGCHNGRNVMSSFRPTGSYSFVWSPCSVVDVERFLSDRWKQCLNDVPQGVAQRPVDPDDRPGRAISADRQCELHAAGYIACTPSAGLQDVCANLHCKLPDTPQYRYYCSSAGVAAAEGTTCGSGRECVSGSCVASTNSNNNNQWRVRDGQCSVTCGSGTRSSIVECVSATNANTVLPDNQCNAAARPNPTQTSCNEGNCVVFEWRIEQGPCSVTCGNGVSQQTVRCYSSVTNYVQDGFCNQGSKPTPAQLPCFMNPCPQINNWSVEPGQCSVTCGSGVRTDVITCRSSTGQTLPDSSCNLSTKPSPTTSACTEAPCTATAYWQSFQFRECSATCGTGIQTRDVWCVMPIGLNLRQLSDDECISQPKPPTTQQCTNPTQCPTTVTGVWVVSGFTQCSLTCGGGTRTRSVDCRPSSTSTQILDDSSCQGPKPVTSEVCNTQNCPPGTTYSWYQSPGAFGPCSVTCGAGVRTTLVLCINDETFQAAADDSYCANSEKPQGTTEICTEEPCQGGPSAYWRTGSFGQCSVTCGNGEQTRQVLCVIDNGHSLIRRDDADCPSPKPEATQPCTNNPCPGTAAVWITSDFSQCSATCGQGIQQRVVTCQSVFGQAFLGDAPCDPNTKPAETRTCNSGACPAPVAVSWETTSWSECSVSCGQGDQTRDIFCISVGDQRVRPDSDCNANARPSASQTCNRGNCPTSATPNQGVRCGGLWTEPVSNLERFSASSDGWCRESIVAQPGYTIKITFTECFVLPNQGRVRDGHQVLNFDCTGSLNDDGEQFSWTSESHLIQMEHLSTAAGQGYTLNVEFIPPSRPYTGCDRVMTDPSGMVTSPNYPNNYPNINQQCQTSVIAPPGMRVEMVYQHINLFSAWWSGCADKIEVYDLDSGDGLRYCGRHNQPSRLRQPDHENRILVQFTSNNDGGVNQGFSFSYTFVPASP